MIGETHVTRPAQEPHGIRFRVTVDVIHDDWEHDDWEADGADLMGNRWVVEYAGPGVARARNNDLDGVDPWIAVPCTAIDGMSWREVLEVLASFEREFEEQVVENLEQGVTEESPGDPTAVPPP